MDENEHKMLHCLHNVFGGALVVSMLGVSIE